MRLQPKAKSTERKPGAFVLLELLIVVSMVALLTGVAMMSLTGLFGKKQFEKEAYAIIDVMKKAQQASAQTDARYAVVFDFVEGAYVLRRYATLDLQTIPDEDAILTKEYFSKNCRLDYVLFDDFMDTREEGDSISEARFIAGRAGWQNGGKIVLLDVDGNPYTIVVNRICGRITLQPGDVDILIPVARDELRF